MWVVGVRRGDRWSTSLLGTLHPGRSPGYTMATVQPCILLRGHPACSNPPGSEPGGSGGVGEGGLVKPFSKKCAGWAGFRKSSEADVGLQDWKSWGPLERGPGACAGDSRRVSPTRSPPAAPPARRPRSQGPGPVDWSLWHRFLAPRGRWGRANKLCSARGISAPGRRVANSGA